MPTVLSRRSIRTTFNGPFPPLSLKKRLRRIGLFAYLGIHVEHSKLDNIGHGVISKSIQIRESYFSIGLATLCATKNLKRFYAKKSVECTKQNHLARGLVFGKTGESGAIVSVFPLSHA